METAPITNIHELKTETMRSTFNAIELQNIAQDTVFVAGSHFAENNFCVCLISKALLKNYITQGKHAPRFLAIDGTYKLNNLMYPTLILGTVDVNRKFHLDILFFLVKFLL